MKEIEIEIGGKTYRLNIIRSEHIQELLDFAKTLLPDPVKDILAVGDLLPEDERKEFLFKKDERTNRSNFDNAVEERKRIATLNHTDLERMCKTYPAMLTKSMQIMFRKYHPDLSLEEIETLLLQYQDEKGDDIFAELVGKGTKVKVAEAEVERRFLRGDRKATRQK